jgi:hypothetical protein
VKFSTLLLALAAASAPLFPAWGSTSETRMAFDVAEQARRSLDGLPQDAQRVAAFQFRASSADFQPGVVRYIQSQVEEGFSHTGRITMVNAPELKTIRIVSTDTTLSVSNNLPTSDDLQKLAERLDVDAFLQGTITRTPQGGVVLSLRLVKAKSGEVAWSQTFTSGTDWGEDLIPGVDLSMHSGLRIFPLGRFKSASDSFSNLKLATNFDIECSVGEPITQNHRLTWIVTVGYSYLSVFGLPDSVDQIPGIHLIRLGVEADAAFVMKDDSRNGYWLGAYGGFDDLIPVLQRHEFCAFRLGLCSKPTRHFSVSAGVLYIPMGNRVMDVAGLGHNVYQLNKIAYELTFLHYTF